MEKASMSDLTPEEANHIQAAIADTCAEIARTINDMQRDQEEIERLKAETRAMLKSLMAA